LTYGITKTGNFANFVSQQVDSYPHMFSYIVKAVDFANVNCVSFDIGLTIFKIL